MSRFNFIGSIPASKSIFNRALIIQSFNPRIQLAGESSCADVLKMKVSICQLTEKRGSVFDAGEAGTVFRFLALRLSREPGQWQLCGSSRLLRRPHQGLLRLLKQLGVVAELTPQGLFLEGQKWDLTRRVIEIDASESSQVASGLMLSAWDLQQDLSFRLSEKVVSESYFNMTRSVVSDFGMRWGEDQNVFTIFKKQTPQTSTYSVEADMSSMATVAALAAIAGQAQITNDSKLSIQPDRVFVDHFKKMGIFIQETDSSLNIQQSQLRSPGTVDLKNTPDLFPILAAMAALIPNQVTTFFGAPHLVDKESNRIQSISEMLQSLGVGVEILDDGARITGSRPRLGQKIKVNTYNDHRVVMAAALLRAGGYDLEVDTLEPLNKSFPELKQFI